MYHLDAQAHTALARERAQTLHSTMKAGRRFGNEAPKQARQVGSGPTCLPQPVGAVRRAVV